MFLTNFQTGLKTGVRSQSMRQRKLPILPKLFLRGLAIILSGYMLFGKGFAYIHVPIGFPLYIGELVMIIGVVALVLHPEYLAGRGNATVVVYLLFAMFGTAGMLRWLPEHGADALRDSAIWYYGIFMILTYAFLANRKRIEKAIKAYVVVAPYFLIIATCFMFVFSFFDREAPLLPGLQIRMILLKGGDLAVHAAAVLAILCFTKKGEIGKYLRGRTLAITAVIFVFFAVVTTNRAGFVAMVSALFMVYIIGRRRQSLGIVAVVLLMLACFLMLDIKIRGTVRREISAANLSASVMSIFGSAKDNQYGSLYLGTRRWRLEWWSEIIEDTFMDKKLFWMGRGFGPNMAVEMGYLHGTNKRPLRSPHSSHLGIVYRMGFPGTITWIMLNVIFMFSLMRGIRRARGRDALLYSGLSVVLCFWTAAQVNGTFDVYLEGPMGGIWFWTIMGSGLALLKVQAENKNNEKLSQ